MDFDTGMFVRSMYRYNSRKSFSKWGKMSKKMLDKTDSDRPYAMLTTDQRSGLINDWRGIAPKRKRQRSRSRDQLEIVKRVRHSLLDFSLLFEDLPKKRRAEIFDIDYPPTDDEEEAEQEAAANALQDGLVDMIAFLFLLLEDDPMADGSHPWTRRLTFRRVLKSGVSKAVKRIEGDSLSWLATVDVDYRGVEIIEPESIDTDRVIDKIAEGNVTELSGPEARWLIQLADSNDSLPDSRTGSWGVDGWEDLGQRIAERRSNRDDIITPEDKEELADMSEDEVFERLREAQSDTGEK